MLLLTGELIIMQHKDNCGVCGKPLVYGMESKPLLCAFCGKTYEAQIFCPGGHYVCDSCHQLEALDVLRKVLEKSASADPLEIFESVLTHPSVPMHGPEHHAILPAVIITAVRNVGYTIPDSAIELAITRGSKVPGGWCGLYGDCGAGVGVGVAVSVLTQATPLTGKPRSQAIGATAFALGRIVDGYPRCCKRCCRNAIFAAAEYLRNNLDIRLTIQVPGVRCVYTQRNKECPKEACSYYLPELAGR